MIQIDLLIHFRQTYSFPGKSVVKFVHSIQPPPNM